MDQLGQNLNRYYTDPDKLKQPSIYALRNLIDYYAEKNSLSLYLDLHAHASKRGCFIYGNVVDSFEDQVQNQMYCRLIAMNTPHFDYEGCLFSKDHMTRIDPGDGMTAEGSSRVFTFLAHKIIHSYTLECNYNTGRIGNDVPMPDGDLGQSRTPLAYRACEPTTNPEKYSPMSYENVGQACLIAMLDIRDINPCPRINKSRFRTLDRLRHATVADVKQLIEFRGQTLSDNSVTRKRQSVAAARDPRSHQTGSGAGGMTWRRCSVAPGIPAPADAQPASQNAGEGGGGNGGKPATGDAASIHSAVPIPPPAAAAAAATGGASKKGAASAAQRGRERLKPSSRQHSAEIANSKFKLARPEFAGNVSDSALEDKRQAGTKNALMISKKLIVATKFETSPEPGHMSPSHEKTDAVALAKSPLNFKSHDPTETVASPGLMHPAPRPLVLLLKGLGGSGIDKHSRNPSVQAVMHTNHATLRRGSKPYYSSDEDADSVTAAGGDSVNVVSEAEVTSTASEQGHVTYPLRASKKASSATRTDGIYKSQIQTIDKTDSDENFFIDKPSVSPPPYRSQTDSMDFEVYDAQSERERAIQHIAKLMGREDSVSSLISPVKIVPEN
jgi:hypothetical protein